MDKPLTIELPTESREQLEAIIGEGGDATAYLRGLIAREFEASELERWAMLRDRLADAEAEPWEDCRPFDAEAFIQEREAEQKASQP